MKKRHLLKSLFLGSVIFFSGSTLFAQGYTCTTDEMNAKVFNEHPDLAKIRDDYNAEIAAKAAAAKNMKTAEQVFIIPVVFHILHENGVENISDAQVIDEINILNRDYAKLNADTAAVVAPFQHLIAKCNIQFRLAQKDPNGNCTNGIDRIYSHRTENANDNSKLNPWPREKYLNVWVIKTMESVGTAGYAYYPSATATYMFPYDGIIIIHQYIGSIGTANVTNSRALTHEIGHWLNLAHTWGSTNNPEVGCGDDGPLDTPVTKGHLSCTNRFDYTCDSKALSETFDFGNVTTSSGTTDPTAVPQTVDSGIVFTQPMAVGVASNSSSAAAFNFAGWDPGAMDAETVYSALTGSVNTGKYYEFTVSPVLAQALTLTGISFKVQRDATGPRTYVVRSSADGYTSNLAASISPSNPNLSVQGGTVFFVNTDTTISLTGSKITLSGASFTNINNTAVTFRIYGYNAEDALGTFSVDDITLTGTHGLIENVENYMEYSYCSKMFTLDQKDRMRTALMTALSGRNNLWLASNLAATGTDGSGTVCTPDPQFYANRTTICKGGTVTFTKNIFNITAGAATTATWSFPGGSPSTSTAASPVVTYATEGVYDVTLTATNSGGTGTVTKTGYIVVRGGYAEVTSTYVEGFENASNFYSRWTVNDLDANGRTWYLSNAAATGSHSVMMNPYYNYRGDVDQLISPSYDLSFMTSPQMSFKLAAATNATAYVDINDKLVVWKSTDCGASWTIAKTLSGTALLNNSYHPEEFIPTSASQWQTVTFNLSGVTGNTRFKFEYTTGNESNSIYLDDIMITGVMGVDEHALDEASVSLYPNPADESTTLYYHMNTEANVKIEVMNVLGKKMMEVNKVAQPAGEYSIQISKNDLNLADGIYMVRLSLDNQTITKKLIIAK
ncbi:MAG: M43 family zinc metalloprotease [Bacteroidia bacterium]